MMKQWLTIMIFLGLSYSYTMADAVAGNTMLPHYRGDDLMFTDTKTREVSSLYPDTTFLYADKANIVAEADNEQDTHAVIVQPIFKSQPKVWIVIQREFSIPFPGMPDVESKFLPNGNLFLVKEVLGDLKEGLTPFKPETLPIDYSVFNKAVEKPTCYALPEDHKLRHCTKEEAELRSPALKVFLGEQ